MLDTISALLILQRVLRRHSENSCSSLQELLSTAYTTVSRIKGQGTASERGKARNLVVIPGLNPPHEIVKGEGNLVHTAEEVARGEGGCEVRGVCSVSSWYGPTLSLDPWGGPGLAEGVAML